MTLSTRCVSRVETYAGEGLCALPAFSMITSTEDRDDSIGVLQCPRVFGVEPDLRLAAVQTHCKPSHRLANRIASANDGVDATNAGRGANFADDGIERPDRPSERDLRSTELKRAGIRRGRDDLDTVHRATRRAGRERFPRTRTRRLLAFDELSRRARVRNVSRARGFDSAVDAAEQAVGAVRTFEQG
jgi:hypothetical protein